MLITRGFGKMVFLTEKAGFNISMEHTCMDNLGMVAWWIAKATTSTPMGHSTEAPLRINLPTAKVCSFTVMVG